jgi:hypothetical protein
VGLAGSSEAMDMCSTPTFYIYICQDYMPEFSASSIQISQETGIPYLQSFAAHNEISNLDELLKFKLSDLAQMGGYNTHVQNEILTLVMKYDQLKRLKQY